MRYEFPQIRHLDDVRPAIEGRDEFIIAERDWGLAVNYMVAMADTFPAVEDELAALRRECRGILFYPDGRIMSRRLHKFFNVNERDETQFHGIDFSQPHVILEKLDGSMITPVFTDAGIRWGTKMGLTEVGMGAEEFVAGNPQYEEFARLCDEDGLTPIFEWCSRKQRIVVDYPEDRLVLIAIRNKVSGEYMPYHALYVNALRRGIDVVKAYPGTAVNMENLMAETKSAEGIEGWIIRFDDGHMLKVKGEWYLRIHRTKDNLTHEKNIVDLLVNDKMDDAKAFMLDDDRRRVEEFESQFWAGVADAVAGYERYFQTVVSSGLDRKQFAQQWMPTIRDNDPFAPPFVFARFDGKDPRQLVLDQIRKNTGTQTRIDSVRALWGGHAWDYRFDGDA
jgi:RNA ligase